MKQVPTANARPPGKSSPRVRSCPGVGRWRLGAVVFVLLLASAPGLAAQESVAPRRLFRDTVQLDTPWLALLREANAGGSQEALLSTISEFLSDLSDVPQVRNALGGGGSAGDATRVFEVVFRASEAADAPLVRIFVHRAGLSRGVLPGIAGERRPLFELFLAEDLNVDLQSTYTSIPQEDPLSAQTAEFVQLLISRLALPVSANRIRASAAAALGGVPAAQKASMDRYPPLAVTLSRVDLPDARAQVTIAHALTMTDPAGHLRSQARWLADTVQRRAVLQGALLQALPGRGASSAATQADQDAACGAIAAALEKVLTEVTQGDECAPLRPDPAKCFAAVRAATGTAHVAAARQHPGCAEAFPLGRRFASMVPDKLPGSKGTVVVRNIPKARWSFGLSSAFLGGVRTDGERPRVEMSGGRIVVDPFTRLLAMGTVSWVPGGYDPGAVRMPLAERIRIFGGVAFAPYFGVTTGAGWALNRHLAANVGYARLGYDAPKAGESLDAPPTPPNRAAPFDLAWTDAWFVGVTFTIR